MPDFDDNDHQAYQEDLEILVDTLRRSFNSEKARYYVVGHQNALFVELEGLEELTNEEITEVSEPIFNELDMDFDEITLLPLKN